jgi:hypothetical protein
VHHHAHPVQVAETLECACELSSKPEVDTPRLASESDCPICNLLHQPIQPVAIASFDLVSIRSDAPSLPCDSIHEQTISLPHHSRAPPA